MAGGMDNHEFHTPADTPPVLTEAERFARIQLIRSENIGPMTFRRLLSQYGDAKTALSYIPELAERGGRKRKLRLCSREKVRAEIEANAEIGARLIVLGDPEYPGLLAQSEDGPPVVSVLGNAHLLNRKCIAIVGSRNASANAVRFARHMAAELGEAGYVVVSGLARGIDASAHQGSLTTGTVAVLAGGIDIIYPKENSDLYKDIIMSGALIAECPVGTTPQARHFPSRNRIISALSIGVVVIEAASRSGSLITARLAGEQGREVFAVPGSPLDPRSKGTNGLIRDGAHVTEKAQDIIDVLDSLFRPSVSEGEGQGFLDFERVQPSPDELDQARDRIMEILGPVPVPVDEIVRQCQFSLSIVSTILLEAELAGTIERHPGNQVARSFYPE